VNTEKGLGALSVFGCTDCKDIIFHPYNVMFDDFGTQLHETHDVDGSLKEKIKCRGHG